LKQVDNKQRKTVASNKLRLAFPCHVKIMTERELRLFLLNKFTEDCDGMNIEPAFLPLRWQIVKSLRQNSHIQKFIAVALLLVFTVSIAPRSFFHDLVANHTDTPGCSIDHKVSAVHKQGIHCHFDDLVVSVPFVLQSESASAPFVLHFVQTNDSYSDSYLSYFLLHKENRGPPVV
jgi:hypothetical protein